MSTVEAKRFREALELHKTGLAIQRQNLRRRHPDLGDNEIGELLQQWLEDRPLDYSPN